MIGTDFYIRGNAGDSVNFASLVYVREQMDGSGDGSYNGQIVVGDKANIDDAVKENSMGGHYQVNFNTATNVLGTLTVSSWRKMKF